MLEALHEELLEERRVGNVPLVGEDRELPDHGFGKAKRDGAKRRLEVREGSQLRYLPVDMFARVVVGPEAPLLGFGGERREWLTP